MMDMQPATEGVKDDPKQPQRVTLKCQVCGGFLDDEDLFCANCGRSVPESDRARESPLTSEFPAHYFSCDGCGASMSYDATAGALRCPFCGSQKLHAQDPAKTLRADWVVPFAVEMEQARNLLRSWLGTGFWRPTRVVMDAVVTKMAPVYAPYWSFSARTYTYWAADVVNDHGGRRGDWRPVTGSHRGEYQGILVGASGVLTQQETVDICPFDMTDAVPIDRADLEHMTVEQFSVARKYARPVARNGIEEQERTACAGAYLRTRFRNLRVNIRMADLTSCPVLLPIWVIAYRYHGRQYRSLINGQTGHIVGEAPFSTVKLVCLVLLVGLVLLMALVMQVR